MQRTLRNATAIAGALSCCNPCVMSWKCVKLFGFDPFWPTLGLQIPRALFITSAFIDSWSKLNLLDGISFAVAWTHAKGAPKQVWSGEPRNSLTFLSDCWLYILRGCQWLSVRISLLKLGLSRLKEICSSHFSARGRYQLATRMRSQLRHDIWGPWAMGHIRRKWRPQLQNKLSTGNITKNYSRGTNLLRPAHVAKYGKTWWRWQDMVLGNATHLQPWVLPNSGNSSKFWMRGPFHWWL